MKCEEKIEIFRLFLERTCTDWYSSMMIDLTSMDFFLWGFIKNDIYSTDVNAVDELKKRIIRALIN